MSTTLQDLTPSTCMLPSTSLPDFLDVPTPVPSFVPPAVDPEPRGLFEGMWSSYDHTNRVLIGNRIELWATRTKCGMTCRPVLNDDDPGERIEFDDRRIVWAFTCIMRLMLKQGTITCRAGDA